MQVIIDRFEGDYAIVEINEGNFANIDKKLIPNCKEGDVIDISINNEETLKRKDSVKNLMERLFKD